MGRLSRLAARLALAAVLTAPAVGDPPALFVLDLDAIPRAEDDSVDVACADVDGDGDLDLVVGLDPSRDQRSIKLLLNNGLGRFDDASDRVPALVSEFGKGHARAFAVALGDIDRDGDVDLLVGTYGGGDIRLGDHPRLLLNDGKGTFSDATKRLPAVRCNAGGVAIGDLDGDGVTDLVVCGSLTAGATVYWGERGEHVYTPLELEDGDRGVAMGDIDADGKVDLLFASCMPSPFFRSLGGRRFERDSRLRDMASGVALADLDGDSDLDAVLCSSLGGGAPSALRQPRIWENGEGRLVALAADRLPELPDMVEGRVTLARDFDGDGHVDLFFACYDTDAAQPQSRLLLGQGKLAFRNATDRLPKLGRATHGAACGDFDSDGDLDIYLANRSARDAVLFNRTR